MGEAPGEAPLAEEVPDHFDPHSAAALDEYWFAEEWGQALDEGRFDPTGAVTVKLKAGQVSLHDGMLIHGSHPNHSSRRRCATRSTRPHEPPSPPPLPQRPAAPPAAGQQRAPPENNA